MATPAAPYCRRAELTFFSLLSLTIPLPPCPRRPLVHSPLYLLLSPSHFAAVYFEQGNYPLAIETCEKAVEEGRDLRADFKLLAKYVVLFSPSASEGL